MKTLVFDTCFNKTYIVLKNNGEIIENKVICNTETNYHSVFLIPELRNILRANNMLFSDINAIGVNIGPGSFTGIRAGITIARVLAQQTNIKTVGVPSLEILAKIKQNGGDTVVVTDARKNKVYFAKYNNGAVLCEPMLVEKDLLVSKLNKDDFVISDGSIGEFLKENGVDALNYEDNDEKLGEFLSEIVEEKLKNTNEDYNWAKVKPLYIQPPSISKPKAKNI